MIELLVVILIIGIISVVTVAVFTETRARARDSRRVKDVRTLHEALAMYVDRNNNYPIVDVALPGIAINGSDAVSQALRVEGILHGGLADPRAGQEINGEIFNYYYYTDAQGKTYTLIYCLETSSIIGQSQGCANIATY